MDDIIDQLFASSLDENSQAKRDILGTVITEKKTKAIVNKSSAVLEIEANLAEAIKRNATPAVVAALNECLAALKSA
jgi:hypothetical protein